MQMTLRSWMTVMTVIDYDDHVVRLLTILETTVCECECEQFLNGTSAYYRLFSATNGG